ncbi:Zinc metallo ase nas-15 [Paramuricea clavata]|uniref:Zinc metallo ase nas-15, partial n=1 Tax=Paramuricea clavata TaxID=317549 RepID=A0A7D9HLJ7_PARCT|nr:Zinc metallo ase nas-15 [Paramuricea clavata]
MHYGSKAFSKSAELETITAIGTRGKIELGNTQMSVLDIIELDALYRCKSNKVNEWTPWSSYSPCDDRCYKNRQRFCYGKTPTSCGGNPNPYGVDSQYVKCSSDECPLKIDGNWGEWTPWSACSHSCNEGKRLRTRKCDNPEPKNKGKPCKGSSEHKILCVQPRCNLDFDDTDFRDGRFGMWENDIYDTPGLNWIIGKGNTPTEGTGPHGDHTTKKDFYLYVESTGRRENDVARLMSKTLPQTSPNTKCFKFFYYMFGRSIGSLTVRLIPEGEQQQVLFTKRGSQSGKWKSAELTLNTAKPYQLVFEATLGKPPYSDIAIDDVFIDDGNCGCQDDPVWNCKRWSLKECKKNPIWMEVYCPVTCQACGCYDKNIWCHYWQRLGQCEKNPGYMKLYCRKACKLCT